MRLGRRGRVGVAVLAALGAVVALVVWRSRGPHPCDEPVELPVPVPGVVACAERYVKDQWYTGSFGKVGALDSDPSGGGSWFSLAFTRRGTLKAEVASLCTHEKDPKGTLGHRALFEGAKASGDAACKVISVAPMLTVALQSESCADVRARARCVDRAAALAGR